MAYKRPRGRQHLRLRVALGLVGLFLTIASALLLRQTHSYIWCSDILDSFAKSALQQCPRNAPGAVLPSPRQLARLPSSTSCSASSCASRLRFPSRNAGRLWLGHAARLLASLGAAVSCIGLPLSLWVLTPAEVERFPLIVNRLAALVVVLDVACILLWLAGLLQPSELDRKAAPRMTLAEAQRRAMARPDRSHYSRVHVAID